MFTVSSFLRPTSLWYFDAATERLETLRTTPSRFNASRHVVEQFEATSHDGTGIPYFLVQPKSARCDGSTPTLLYGYGGFQIPLLPSYAGLTGRLRLEQGYAYVVANLRGGCEFGPRWHEAAQRATKQRTWDDFIAVAEDLIRRKITSPRRLGVVGGSQGGLLVGTAITQRPDLFNAAIVQVPLFDMLRFTWPPAPPGPPSMAIPPCLSSANGSRPTRPIRSWCRARPTRPPSFSPPPRTTAFIRPLAARQPQGSLG